MTQELLRMTHVTNCDCFSTWKSGAWHVNWMAYRWEGNKI